jgi:tetratricopeptide (TPR) repeat protein
MPRCFLLLLVSALAAWGQSSGSSPAAPNNPPSASSQTPGSTSSGRQVSDQSPNLTPPHSDHVNADSLDDEPGESSSKDTQIDLSPPEGDAKAHPRSAEALADEGSGGVQEFHPWDPHKAAKDVEVGDFYFKRKNYKAAEDRYREALLYKDNDAIAAYRLAVCLEKMGRRDEALTEFENYLTILPHGPEAGDAKKAIARLTASASDTKPAR